MNKKIAKTHGSVATFSGETQLTDAETGEIFNAKRIEYKNCDRNFTKLWMGHILDVLDIIGNKKIQLLSWLLEAKDKNNMIFKSIRDIAKDTGLCTKTINITLKSLEEANIITRKQAVIIFNPDVIFKGSHERRMDVLITYRNLQND